MGKDGEPQWALSTNEGKSESKPQGTTTKEGPNKNHGQRKNKVKCAPHTW